jgi:histidinol-phosphate aminotransferase
VLSLAAAAAAVQDREYLAETRKKIVATRERLTDSLRRLGFDVTPSQANFVWARRSDRPVKALYEALKARRILVRYMSYPEYGDGLRVTVGTDAEIDTLLTELESLLARP